MLAIRPRTAFRAAACRWQRLSEGLIGYVGTVVVVVVGRGLHCAGHAMRSRVVLLRELVQRQDDAIQHIVPLVEIASPYAANAEMTGGCIVRPPRRPSLPPRPRGRERRRRWRGGCAVTYKETETKRQLRYEERRGRRRMLGGGVTGGDTTTSRGEATMTRR